MGKFNKEVDDYIARSADFAKPLLEHFRQIVHTACPEAEENIKWGMPFFNYRNEMLCHMAAFKKHIAIGFWKASLMKDSMMLQNAGGENAKGYLGAIKSMGDMPAPRTLKMFVAEAMRLNDDGIRLSPRPRSSQKKELVIPPAFIKALKGNAAAAREFGNFSVSFKREYVDWFNEAKTDVTREKRMQAAIELIAEGKTRHWKYKKR